MLLLPYTDESVDGEEFFTASVMGKIDEILDKLENIASNGVQSYDKAY